MHAWIDARIADIQLLYDCVLACLIACWCEQA